MRAKRKEERKTVRKFGGIFLSAFLLFALAPCVYAADTPLAIATGGRYTLENGKSYTITITNTFYNCNINVPAGRTAFLTVNGNLVIDDTSYGISPISVEGNARLTLVVNGALTVRGGHAQAASMSTDRAQSKAGGYAGISVPTGATLVLTGGGTTFAYGGNANFGGAGAGIGGNGGTGNLIADLDYTYANGGTGGSAGTVVIQKGAVWLFGGAAGNVTNINGDYLPVGGTGGGYPAAGMGGGGGAGGSWGGGIPAVYYFAGGGGFNGGGGGGATRKGSGGSNGGAGATGQGANNTVGASGYFAKGNGAGIGGGWAVTGRGYHSGQGGSGGAGGSVTVADGARVTAYNGNYNSNSPANASYQTPIYAQLGYDLNRIRSAGITTVSGRTASAVASNLSAVAKTVTPPALGLGFGSGAGYTEGGNGAYLDETSRSGLPIVEADGVENLSIYGWAAPAYSGSLTLTKYQVDVYGDAECKTLVKSAQTSSSAVPGADAPLKVTGLTPGETYYVTVSAWYGSALGLPSEAAEGRLPNVIASPESGSYYKSVTCELEGVNTAGYEVMYAVDGSVWKSYPTGGIVLKTNASVQFGLRKTGAADVQKLGERAYVVSPHAVTFSSLTLHNSANGTGGALSLGDISGLTGQITAKLTGVTSYTSDAGYIVLALYGETGKMERMTLTPIGGRSGDVVSKAIALPGGLSGAHAVRAFVLESFADVAPVGKIAQIGGVG